MQPVDRQTVSFIYREYCLVTSCDLLFIPELMNDKEKKCWIHACVAQKALNEWFSIGMWCCKQTIFLSRLVSLLVLLIDMSTLSIWSYCRYLLCNYENEMYAKRRKISCKYDLHRASNRTFITGVLTCRSLAYKLIEQFNECSKKRERRTGPKWHTGREQRTNLNSQQSQN